MTKAMDIPYTRISYDFSSLKLPKLSEAAQERAIQPVRDSGPLNLILIRHARSERNEVEKLLRAGRISKEQARALMEQPDNLARLISFGCKQGELAGEWLKKHLGFKPDVAFCSHFVRARQTAGIIGKTMGLKTRWYRDSKYGERWWGDFDRLSPDEKEREYGKREDNARYWTPPRGESLRFIEMCARSALGALYRKYTDRNVMIVTHGEFIVAMRAGIERLSDEGVNQAVAEGIPNCGIVQYTRQNPFTGEISDSYDWVRFVNPAVTSWKISGWDGQWKEVIRPSYSSDELLLEAEKFPRFLEDV